MPLWTSALTLLRRAVEAWIDDRAPSMGAALAFYTLFSAAPLLLIVISVAGLVFGEDAARGAVMAQLTGLMGAQGAQAVEALLRAINDPAAGVNATVVGVVMLLIGATTVFAELQDALDRIWRVPPASGAASVWQLIRNRILSLGLVLAIGFLLTVLLVVSSLLAALGTWWGERFAAIALLGGALDLLLSMAFLTVVFAFIYKWMPRVRVAWRDVWIGAVLTAMLFTLGKTLIALYLGRSAMVSAYGAAASLTVLLLWVYYSAQIFLFGAELTRVVAERRASHGAAATPPPATGTGIARPPHPLPTGASK